MTEAVFIPDHLVLIALNGGDNIFHLVVSRFAQLFLKYIIGNAHGILDHELHLPITDFVLTL